MTQKWQELFEQIDFSDHGKELCNASDFARFETDLGFIFPDDYKTYCQLFGTGLLGYAMHVYAPTPHLIEYSNGALELLKERVERFPSKNSERNKRLFSLFESSFIFADDSGVYVAMWDLRTYSEEDKSYEIYWIATDDPSGEDGYSLGRSFYEFVYGFCFGRLSYDFLPEDLRPPSDEPQTFQSFLTSHP
jgi:SMI1-KNR4 cell-wall